MKNDLQVEHIAAASWRDVAASAAPWIDEWRTLAGGEPLRQPEWLLSWWTHFGAPGEHGAVKSELCLLTVRDASRRLVGLAPWMIERSAAEGAVIRWLGSGVVCTDHLTLLAAPDEAPQVAAALADWLCDEGAELWQRVELTGVDSDDPAVAALMHGLAARGAALHTRSGDNTWRLTLPETWEEFIGRFSTSRRYMIRKFQRRQFDSGRCVLEAAETAEDFDRSWDVFVELHQARRRMVGDPGVFSRPAFAAFLRDAAERLFAQGQLDLLVLEQDGRPIAVEFNPLSADAVYGYQAGIDPERMAERPGHLMQIARLQRALSRGRRTIDFMRGDESYKAEWGAERVASTEFRAIQARPLAKLRHGVWLAGQSAKRIAKTGLKATQRRRRSDGEERATSTPGDGAAPAQS